MVRLAPQGYERGLVRVPLDKSPLQGLEVEKNKKNKNEGGVFVLKEQIKRSNE